MGAIAAPAIVSLDDLHAGRITVGVMPKVVVVMGVSGSGKTTVGRLAAERAGCAFADADHFHPTENITKMKHGEPLNDADRWVWLAALANFICTRAVTSEGAIVACSALRHTYRQRLMVPAQPDAVGFAYLRISPEAIRERFSQRRSHFMPAALIDSQFAELEEPTDALMLDATRPAEELAALVADFKNN
jgi:gluconokinase